MYYCFSQTGMYQLHPAAQLALLQLVDTADALTCMHVHGSVLTAASLHTSALSCCNQNAHQAKPYRIVNGSGKSRLKSQPLLLLALREPLDRWPQVSILSL